MSRPDCRASTGPHGLWGIFRAPLLLGLATLAGLLAALLGDGVWDALSWALLCPAVYWSLRALRKPRLPRPPHSS